MTFHSLNQTKINRLFDDGKIIFISSLFFGSITRCRESFFDNYQSKIFNFLFWTGKLKHSLIPIIISRRTNIMLKFSFKYQSNDNLLTKPNIIMYNLTCDISFIKSAFKCLFVCVCLCVCLCVCKIATRTFLCWKNHLRFLSLLCYLNRLQRIIFGLLPKQNLQFSFLSRKITFSDLPIRISRR